MDPTEVIIPIAFFAMIFGILYVRWTTLHRQRMAMIEKGMDPSTLGDNNKVDNYRTLRNGMFLAGIGVGLFLGRVLEQTMFAFGEDNPLPYFIMVLICGGAALIGHHLIVRRKQQG